MVFDQLQASGYFDKQRREFTGQPQVYKLYEPTLKLQGVLSTVLEKLEGKLAAVVSAAKQSGQTNETINFLKSLLANDPLDDSGIPRIFQVSRRWRQEEVRSDLAPFDKEADTTGAMDDIGVSFDDVSDKTSYISYRSYYYSVIISALEKIGDGASRAVADCLKEIDSIRYLENDGGKQRKIKIGRDLTATEYRQKKLEEKQQFLEQGGLYGDTDEWKEGELINRIEHDEFSTADITMIDYEDTEFGKPTRAAFDALARLPVDEQVAIYLIEETLAHHQHDWLENFQSIVAILNQHPEKSATMLMQKIQQNDGEVMRAYATRALYYLELGKIGISAEGVKYLGKVFDLGGEYNRAEYSAHRATADGKVAVFGADHRALGYFQLAGLDSPEQKVSARLLEFTYETLFYPKPDETPEERAEREAILEEFKEKYFETYLTDFKNETGVMFNNLSFREQGWFLWYVQHADEQGKRRVMDFVKTYREDGLKTFLSLEHDRQNGERIVSLGEDLDSKTANAIFKKYGKIAELAADAGDYLRKKFKRAAVSDAEIQSTIDAILKKGKDLLVGYAEKIKAAKARGEKIDYAQFAQEINEQLKHFKADIVLFASAFKVASREKKLEFSDIQNAQFESKDSGELSQAEKQEMERIFVENRPQYAPELLRKTVEEFEEAMNSAGKKFYLLKIDNEITSFMRLDRRDEHRLYAGSLNVRNEVRGSAIGSAVLQAVLDHAATTHDIEAVVYEKNPMLKHYLNDFGFQIVGEDTDYEGTGQRFVKIERPVLSKPRPHPEILRAAA